MRCFKDIADFLVGSFILLHPVDKDQPNSQGKMRDFTAEFLKCAKYHGKFTEGV